MDLAHVVVQARHLQPLRLGRHHAPAGQVVQRRAPQHGLLATGVHGDVAANAGGLDAGGIHRKHQAGTLGCLGHADGHHTGTGPHGRHRMVHAGQLHHLDFGQLVELFGVDDGTLPGQRDGTAGVAGTAATRHDGQAQIDTALDQFGHFGLGIGGEHDQGILDAPVGRIGHMADTAQAVKLDIVLARMAAQAALHLLAQLQCHAEGALEAVDRLVCQPQQLGHGSITALIVAGLAATTALVDLAQAMAHGLDQHGTALGVVQQVVLHIGIALDHPHVTQHLVQHAGGTAGFTLAAQFGQQLPAMVAHQAFHDLGVREAGVVVGNLADTLAAIGGGQQVLVHYGCIHGDQGLMTHRAWSGRDAG